MNPPSVRRTVIAKRPIKPVGGIAGMGYASYLRGGGMSNPTPTSTPPKPRKSLIRRRLPVIQAQAPIGSSGLAKAGGLKLRGRFGR